MKKDFFKVLFVAAVALLTVSCSDKDKDNDVTVDRKVAVLLPDDSMIERWGIDKKNLENAMNRYGLDATFYTAPETAEGANQQVDQLEKAINDGIKYIVITAIDYKKINASNLIQNNPDVKVVCHDRFLLDNPNIAYVSSANTKAVGHMQAMFLLTYFRASGKPSMTLEILEGPETDVNAKDYYDGAMEKLKPLIDNDELIVKSGKINYDDVKANSWSVEDGKSDMQDRLSYYEGECPELILAAIDNQAQGVIEALNEINNTITPVITGQDNSTTAKQNILDGKQTMTIDKSLEEMAFNTAMIVNGLIHNVPVQTIDYVTIGSTKIPVMYSKLITMVKDSYPY
ncbi:MAG: substrate-binding domain-containing protein [Bacteroidaceae bacterium]|nr:substrate-binding domain-containing protein [Bacteroidaceae bacterium]